MNLFALCMVILGGDNGKRIMRKESRLEPRRVLRSAWGYQRLCRRPRSVHILQLPPA